MEGEAGCLAAGLCDVIRETRIWLVFAVIAAGVLGGDFAYLKWRGRALLPLPTLSFLALVALVMVSAFTIGLFQLLTAWANG
jgi:hypothetical protein